MLIRSLVLILIAPSALAQVTDLVSRSAAGEPGNGNFYASVALSRNGRVVAFDSSSSNLVPGDTNGKRDVFVRGENGALVLVSRGLAGAPADGDSEQAALSGDGRTVVFLSYATNLVSGDTNAQRDLFAYDRELGTLERVDVDSQGAQSASSFYVGGTYLTHDGRYVVFDSLAGDLVPGDTNGTSDLFLRDRLLGTTTRLSTALNGSQLAGESVQGRLTPNGRYLVFVTSAPLVNGDFNNHLDVYVRDYVSPAFERISVSSQGVEGLDNSYEPSITPDGRFVVFYSHATNLVMGDVNNEPDIFVRDRLLGTTQRVNVSSQGAQANFFSYNPRITNDGRFVYFSSPATNLVPGDSVFSSDIFVRDRRRGTTTRVGLPPADDWIEAVFALSPDGSHLAFVARPAPQSAETLPQVYVRVQPAPGPAPIR
jgi:Tol biopolymer transport system component